MLGLPKHLINGATIRLATRGKDVRSAYQTVFSVRTSTREEWRCFGMLHARHTDDFRLHVRGNDVVIDATTFKRRGSHRRRARDAGCWRARDKVSNKLTLISDSSVDCGECVGARWGGLQDAEHQTGCVKHCKGEETPREDVSNADDTSRGCDERTTLRKQEERRRTQFSPTSVVLDWDFYLEVLPGGSGGRESLFHAWENTAYLPETGVLIFKRDQLDRVKKSVPTVVVEIRFKDADNCSTDDEEEDEDDIPAPSDWSCVDSAISHLHTPEVLASEVETESHASTASHPSQQIRRPFPSMGCAHLAWPSWSGYGQQADAQTDELATSISQPGHTAWHSFDAAWSQGWLGAPGCHSLGVAKL